MFVDTRMLPDGSDLEFDVCIVGSGPAGLAAALGLRGSGLRVGILESGGFDLDPATQDLYQGRLTGIETWGLTGVRFRLFGGTSLVWAGWCKPLRREDFDERPWMPMSGWPIRYSDVEAYYPAARRFLDLTDLPFDAASIAALDGVQPAVRDTERLRNEVFQFSPPTRLGTKLRGEIDADPDIVVHLWANATEIVLEPGFGRVDHLVVRTLAGPTARVRAEVFVLATGGIENARLLLASSAQIPEGVANGSGFVGRCFAEHPHHFECAAWVLPRSIDPAFYRQRPIGSPEAQVCGVLALAPETRAAEGLPGFTAELVDADPAGAETGVLPPATIGAAIHAKSHGEQFLRLNLRLEQSPDPDSRVTLQTDRDPLGMPRPSVHWQVRDDDRRRLRRALEIVGAELAAQGLGRLWTPTDASGAFSWTTNAGHHHLGTTRMSADPTRGVVDGNGRAHDVSNLYVLGSSVFPTGGDSNPTLTIVAMADRFAAHLRGVHR